MKRSSLALFLFVTTPTSYGGTASHGDLRDRATASGSGNEAVEQENTTQTPADQSNDFPLLPAEIWQLIGNKLAEKYDLRARSSLAQVSRATRDGLGKLSYGVPVATLQQTLGFFKQYIDQPDLWRAATEAGKNANCEPEHLPLLAIAFETTCRMNFQKKLQAVSSAEGLARHWYSVLGTYKAILQTLVMVIRSGARTGVLALDGETDDFELDPSLDLDAVLDAVHATEKSGDTAAINAPINAVIKSTDPWERDIYRTLSCDHMASFREFPFALIDASVQAAHIAARNAARSALTNNESPEIIAAVAYRSAETAAILSFIYSDALVDAAYNHTLQDGLSSEGSLRDLRQGPLASIDSFKRWKKTLFGDIHGDLSIGLLQGMVDELETLALKFFAMRDRP